MDVKYFVKNGRLSMIIKLLKRHSVTVGLFLLFLSGLVAGALMFRFQTPASTLIVSAFRRYNGLVVSNGFLKNLYNLLLCNTLTVALLFFLGFSALGAPLVCAVSFIKGAGIGIVSSYLYSTYHLSGFGYCMLSFFPAQIIIMLALFIGMNESYVNSKNLYKTISATKQSAFDFRLYSLRYLFVALSAALSSLVGALMNTFVSGVFIK